MAGFFKRNALPLVLSCVLVGSVVVMGSLQSSAEQEQAGLDAQVAQIQGELKALQDQSEQKSEENVLEALGVTASRIEADTRVLDSFMETAFTWDSGEEYNEARDTLIRRFKLPADSGFLKEFMPESTYNIDGNGKEYHYLDAVGLNSSMGADPELEVVKVVGTEYTYAVMGDLSMTSDLGVRTNEDGTIPAKPSAQRKLLLYATVDAEGQLSDLSGIPASGTTRSSDR